MTADAKLAERIAGMRRGVLAIDAAGNLPVPSSRVSAALRPALVAFADALETTQAATAACDTDGPDASVRHLVRLLAVYDAGEAKVAEAAEQFGHAAELADDAGAGVFAGLAAGYALDARGCCETMRANAHRLTAILAEARAAGCD